MKHFNSESKISGWELTHSAWVFLNGVFDHAAPVLSEYGLHQKSLVLLALLDQADNPQQIAHLLRSPASSVSHLLKEMEEKGLMTRSIDPLDKRRFRLARTAAGNTALQAGIAAINKAVAERMMHFDPEERETLERALPLLSLLISEKP